VGTEEARLPGTLISKVGLLRKDPEIKDGGKKISISKRKIKGVESWKLKHELVSHEESNGLCQMGCHAPSASKEVGAQLPMEGFLHPLHSIPATEFPFSSRYILYFCLPSTLKVSWQWSVLLYCFNQQFLHSILRFYANSLFEDVIFWGDGTGV
jgi:hypothetical protein